MSEISTILPEPVSGQEALILDHGKKEDGFLKYKDDISTYGWNIKQFNQMHVGAFVLNRHPKRVSNGKFEIYAGGYVESISEPDLDGFVTATITHIFNIIPPITQGDPFIENFEWTSKTKRPNDWGGNFWNQYGMNRIDYSEFERLIKGANCVSVDIDNSNVKAEESDITTEELSEFVGSVVSGFTVEFVEDGRIHSRKDKRFKEIAKNVNYEKIQRAKNRIGAIGEAIALDILMKKAEDSGLRVPVHVSKEEGDGLGYDIRYWNEKGEEIHVEVKTSKGIYADGFEMSRNEVEASKDVSYKYEIFRIYCLNMKTKECRVKVYKGPISDDLYRIEPTKVAVFQK